MPVLAVRAGVWRWAQGVGNASSWSAPGFDDSAWRNVSVPADWRSYGYRAENASGWYRRNFTVTPAMMAAAAAGQLRLALGDVASSDVTFVNGARVGATGGRRWMPASREKLGGWLR